MQLSAYTTQQFVLKVSMAKVSRRLTFIPNSTLKHFELVYNDCRHYNISLIFSLFTESVKKSRR